MKGSKLFEHSVGDKLFFVPSDTRSGYAEYLTVVKKGTKYLELEKVKAQSYESDHYPFVIGNVSVYPHGHIYKNKEDWLLSQKIKDLNINIGHKSIDSEQYKRILEIVEETNPEFFPNQKTR
jgi:hypothetical protein